MFIVVSVNLVLLLCQTPPPPPPCSLFLLLQPPAAAATAHPRSPITIPIFNNFSLTNSCFFFFHYPARSWSWIPPFHNNNNNNQIKAPRVSFLPMELLPA